MTWVIYANQGMKTKTLKMCKIIVLIKNFQISLSSQGSPIRLRLTVQKQPYTDAT